MRARYLPLALLLAFLAFWLYAWMAAPDILYGDAGEFQFTLPLAGVSHPTGYPLFHGLGWIWERGFQGNPARGANLFSAMWGGVAVGMAYLLSAEALERLLARMAWPGGTRWLALITTLLFALNPTLWALSVQAEVYTMQVALMAAFLAAVLAAGRRRDPWPLWPAALLLGLGLAHHLTILFLIPGALLFLWLTQPQALRPRAMLRLLPWVLGPLLLYLYIPWRAGASPWLFPHLTPDEVLPLFDHSPLGVLRFILGIGFASALGTVSLPARLAQAGQLYLAHFTGIGLGVAGLGLVALVIEGAWPLLILTGTSFLLLQLFNLLYGIGDIATYYLPLYLLVTLWLGLGLAYVVEGLTRLTSPRWRRYGLLVLVLALWIPWQVLPPQRAQWDRREDRAPRARWEGILAQPLDPHGILVSNDRDEMVPLIYLQQIEHRATGMLGLFPRIAATPEWADLNGTLKQALATTRPVYLIKPMPGIEALYRVRPVGGDVFQVLGPQRPPAQNYEAPYTSALRWLGVTWSGPVEPGATLTITLYWRAVQQPPQVWHSFLHLTDPSGDKVAQAQDHRPGGDYMPSPLWRPGDVIVDSFQLPLPAEMPPGEYTLLAGFYDPTTGQRVAPPLEVAILRR